MRGSGEACVCMRGEMVRGEMVRGEMRGEMMVR